MLRLAPGLLLLALHLAGCKAPVTPAPAAADDAQVRASPPPEQGWYCYEGAQGNSAGYRDYTTNCTRQLDDCRRNHGAEGIVGQPPPPTLTECTPRETAICGAAHVQHERPTTPFSHCHTTMEDCQGKQASLAAQPAVSIVQPCTPTK